MFGYLRNRIQGLKDELGSSAGIDPLHDRFLVGAIATAQDILDIRVEDIDDQT